MIQQEDIFDKSMQFNQGSGTQSWTHRVNSTLTTTGGSFHVKQVEENMNTFFFFFLIWWFSSPFSLSLPVVPPPPHPHHTPPSPYTLPLDCQAKGCCSCTLACCWLLSSCSHPPSPSVMNCSIKLWLTTALRTCCQPPRGRAGATIFRVHCLRVWLFIWV